MNLTRENLAATLEILLAETERSPPLVVPEAILRRPGARLAAEEVARMYGFDGVVADRPLPLA